MKATSAARRGPPRKLVVVIENDRLILEATSGLLRSWNIEVIAASGHSEAIAQLAERGQRPDLIVCDYRLSQGAVGTDVIRGLRRAFEIPALLISGDAQSGSPQAETCNLLHKPVHPEALRTALIDASVLPPSK